MAGVPLELVLDQDIGRTFLCQLCTKVAASPHECLACGQIYCKQCISKRLGRCQKCNQECTELGKFMSRIYNTLSVLNNGEKLTMEAYIKQISEGSLKQTSNQAAAQEYLRCRKFWDAEDHVCTSVCQIYINMLGSLNADPSVIYSQFEEIQKSMKGLSGDQLD